MSSLKRILLIVAFLALVVLIGFGLYYFFKKTQSIQQPPTGGGATTQKPGTLPGSQERGPETGGGEQAGPGSLPSAGVTTQPVGANFFRSEPVTKITGDPALYPSVSEGGNFRYHNAADGKFYRTNADGSLSALSSQVFYNVQNVTWAKNQDKAVLEYPDGSKIVYNFETEKQTTLPKHWENFSFSGAGDQIAAKSIGLSPENRWLVATRDDGTGTRLLEPLGNNADKVKVDWSPSGQTVAFSQTGAPQGTDRREILLLGQNNENFKSLLVEGLNFQPKWSNTGQRLIYSVDSTRSDYKPELWVVNAYGDTIGSDRRSLQINTWANKCTFADDATVYCAIPRELPTGAGMAPALAKEIDDDLYKIDLKTGLKTPIEMGSDYSVNTISYDQKRNKLIFTDNQQVGAFEVNL